MGGSPQRRRYSLRVPVQWPARASALDRTLHLLAIGGPIGFLPWVPATFASLFTTLACWWLQPGLRALALFVAVLFFLGAWWAGVSERVQGTSDPRNVVVDEIAGQALAFLVVTPMHAARAAAGFVLFRIFDVIKPFPARASERLPAGWGIMADDLIAGAYAAAALWLLRRWVC